MTITTLRRLAAAAATAVIVTAGVTSVAGASTSPLIQNPFGPPKPFTPPPTSKPSDPDRPFGNPAQPQRKQYRNVAHYLLGIWHGRLNNGTVVKFSLSRDGKFSLIDVRRGVAQVGYWRVQGMKIQLIAVGMCDRSRCVRYPQRKQVVFAIKPVSADAMRTPGGSFRRA